MKTIPSAHTGPPPPLTTAYIGLGSNLGNRNRLINKAIDEISRISGIRLTKSSSLHETKPVGGPPQGNYLNAVLQVECSISPHQLLRELHRIENQLGRDRQGKNFPRTIDLDILLFGEQVINEPELNIPHPRMHERGFVLNPLVEIAPQAVHPITGLTVAELRRTYLRRHRTPSIVKEQCNRKK